MTAEELLCAFCRLPTGHSIECLKAQATTGIKPDRLTEAALDDADERWSALIKEFFRDRK